MDNEEFIYEMEWLLIEQQLILEQMLTFNKKISNFVKKY